MAERQNKVKKYRKPLNLNIGMLIFGAIFIYVIICVIMYFQTDHIVRYEVTEGSLATNNIYKGIAIRKEEVVSTDTAGYVNFYAREGERVAKGDTVYIVDETGRLSQELEDASLGENTLSNQELSEFRNEIVNFMHGYDDVTYESTYDFKYSLKNTVLKLANVNMLQSIKNENGGSTANIVNFCYAPTTGIVAYWTDGYEGLTVEGVTEAVFDHKYHDRSYVSVYNVPSFAAGDFSHNTVNLLMFTGFRLFYEQFTNGICQHDADFQDQHFDCIFPGFYEFSQNCIVVIAGQGKQYPRHKKHDHQTGCITKNIRSLTSGHRLPGASIIFQNILPPDP